MRRIVQLLLSTINWIFAATVGGSATHIDIDAFVKCDCFVVVHVSVLYALI